MFNFSELEQKLSQYLLDPPSILPEGYERELEFLIRMFKRITTPTFVKKGNIVELQDPFPEHPNAYRTRLSTLALARLEREISIDHYLKEVSKVKNEFEQGNNTVK